MSAADLIHAVLQAGGMLWPEGEQIHLEGVPLDLIPALRERKAEVLALLVEIEAEEDDDTEERLAIQSEAEQPPFTAEELALPIPGFEGLEPATLRDHHEAALMAAGCIGSTPTSASDSRAVPTPAIGIRCADCSHFAPKPSASGDPAHGIGTCQVTGGHLSPSKQACWPRAPRRCAAFQGVRP